MAGELPLLMIGATAAIGAGAIPDPKMRAMVRFGGLALAGVAAYRLVSSKGSLLAGIAGELGVAPAKPGEIVSGGPVPAPAGLISSTHPELTSQAPGELIVTPPKPTHAFARIVDPAPGGSVGVDFVGKTYSVLLEVTNPGAVALAPCRVEIATQEHDSGFFEWDTAKPTAARTFVDIPALDPGGAWRGEVKVRYSGDSFYLSRSIFARLLVDGKFSSSTHFWITRWVEGWL